MDGFKATDIKGLVEDCLYPPSVEFFVSDKAREVNIIRICGLEKELLFTVTVPNTTMKEFSIQKVSGCENLHR